MLNKYNDLILHAYTGMGDIYELTGQYDKALKYHHIIADKFHKDILSIIRIAEIYEKMGKYDDALQMLSKHSSELNKKSTDIESIYKYHILKAWLYTNKGKLKQAEREIEKTKLLIANSKKKTSAVYKSNADAYNIQAEIAYNRGNYREALKYYEQSIEQAKKTKDIISVSILKSNMAKIYYELRDYEKTKDCINYRLNIAVKTGDKRGEALAYGGLANIHFDQGDYNKALEYYMKNLNIAKTLHDKKTMGMAIGNIANIYYFLGQYDNAIEYYKKSITLLEETGHSKSIAISHCNLGSVYFHKGNLDKALKYQLILYNTANKLNDRILLAHAHKWMGHIYREMGDFKKSLKNHNESLKIMKKISNKIFAAESHIDIGNTYLMMGNYRKAIDEFTASLKIGQDMKNDNHMEICQYHLGKSHLLCGDIKTASHYLDSIEEAMLNDEHTPDEYMDYIATYARYYVFKDKRKAIACAKQALKKASNLQSSYFKALAYRTMGFVLKYSGKGSKQKEADKYYKKALKLFTEQKNIANITILKNEMTSNH